MASKWNAGGSSDRNSPELKGTEGHMKSGVGLCASIPQGEDLLTTLWSYRMSTVNILLILGMWERSSPLILVYTEYAGKVQLEAVVNSWIW